MGRSGMYDKAFLTGRASPARPARPRRCGAAASSRRARRSCAERRATRSFSRSWISRSRNEIPARRLDLVPVPAAVERRVDPELGPREQQVALHVSCTTAHTIVRAGKSPAIDVQVAPVVASAARRARSRRSCGCRRPRTRRPCRSSKPDPVDEEVVGNARQFVYFPHVAPPSSVAWISPSVGSRVDQASTSGDSLIVVIVENIDMAPWSHSGVGAPRAAHDRLRQAEDAACKVRADRLPRIAPVVAAPHVLRRVVDAHRRVRAHDDRRVQLKRSGASPGPGLGLM